MNCSKPAAQQNLLVARYAERIGRTRAESDLTGILLEAKLDRQMTRESRDRVSELIRGRIVEIKNTEQCKQSRGRRAGRLFDDGPTDATAQGY